MSEIVVKTENVIAVVAQARRALESGDVSTGYRLFGDAKRSGIAIIKETEYLLERVTAVEKHYREMENAKSREIGVLYNREKEAQQKKETKRASMRSKERNLQQARSELTSSNEKLSRARQRRDEAESKKEDNIAAAVGLGIATVLTLGLAAPITVPVATVCTINAVEASHDEENAKGDVKRAKNEIDQCEREISQCRSDIRQLDSDIASLSQQVSQMKSERDKIHTQRGEIGNAIKCLHDMLCFWKEFGQLTERGTDRATFLQKLSEFLQQRIRNKQPASLPQHMQSCVSAWECVEKKMEKANEHTFSIDFTCHFCRNAFHSLPHLSSGKFCCIGCFTK